MIVVRPRNSSRGGPWTFLGIAGHSQTMVPLDASFRRSIQARLHLDSSARAARELLYHSCARSTRGDLLGRQYNGRCEAVSAAPTRRERTTVEAVLSSAATVISRISGRADYARTSKITQIYEGTNGSSVS